MGIFKIMVFIWEENGWRWEHPPLEVDIEGNMHGVHH